MAHSFGAEPQPKTTKEKVGLAKEFMVDKPTRPKGAPKFHRMSITAAENGVSIEHTIKKFKNDEKTHGANDAPGSGAWGPDTETKTHVLNSDHPMMAHLNALHAHCSGGDCDED